MKHILLFYIPVFQRKLLVFQNTPQKLDKFNSPKTEKSTGDEQLTAQFTKPRALKPHAGTVFRGAFKPMAPFMPMGVFLFHAVIARFTKPRAHGFMVVPPLTAT